MRASAVAVLVVFAILTAVLLADDPPQDAPTGFALITNGFTSQADFDANFAQFSDEAQESGDDDPGLGPVFNGKACATCHPKAGSSTIRVIRCGKLDATGAFIPPVGGTLVHLFATDPAAQQRVPDGMFSIQILTPTLLGSGFIEAIRDSDILAYRDSQPADVRGVAVMVPITTGFDADGKPVTVQAVGRFFRKSQFKGLHDAAADALRNEVGRTSPLQPTKSTALDGRLLTQFIKTTGLNDPPTADAPMGKDVTAYSRLMRALPAPPEDFVLSATDDAKAGSRLFGSFGCIACHRPSYVTAPVGSVPTGLQPVSAAIGNKTIFPYSDFLLHNLEVGDNEVVQGAPELRKWRKTQPLWGVRTRPLLGHSGQWANFEEAIQGHGGQATAARTSYRNATAEEQRKTKVFLSSR